MKTLRNISICITIVASMFLITAKANAQKSIEYSPIKVEAGMRFLPLFSSFEMRSSNGDKVSGQTVTGYGAGTFMNYNFTKHLGFQVEINYSSIYRSYTESEIKRTVNLQYIEIPLLFTFNTNKTKLINFNVVLGPQIGVAGGNNIYISGGEEISPKPILSIRSANLGIAYGTGVDFGLNHSHTLRLGVGYRGMVGLSDISNNITPLPANSYYIIERTTVNTHAAYISLSILL